MGDVEPAAGQPYSRHRRPSVPLALGLALLIALLTFWDVVADYQANRRMVAGQMEQVATFVARQVEEEARIIADLLNEAAQGDAEGRPLSWLKGRLQILPGILSLSVIDATGTVVGKVGKHAGMPDGLSSAVFLAQLRTHMNKDGQAVTLTERDGQAIFSFVRPRPAAQGGFAGVVVLEAEAALFEPALSAATIIDGVGITLSRHDGGILLRYPEEAAPEDDSANVSAIRALAAIPLTVSVTMTSDEAFAEARARAVSGLLSALAVALALVIFAVMLDRRERARAALEEQLAAYGRDLERQVSERTIRLSSVNAELEQFAYVASHDLQEPLRTVISFLQLLEKRTAGKLGAEEKEYVDFAVQGAKRMSRLIQDLMAFSRLGRLDAEPQPVDTQAVAAEACTSLRGAIDETGAQVLIGPLPVVHGIRTQIASIFLNLIGNSIKYRALDRVPELRIEAERNGNFWHFTVADNGIGIGEEYLERVFGIFQRLHTIEDYDGTGIGLALVRKVVESHGGRAWAAQNIHHGAIIHFTLPAEPAPLS